MWWWWLLACEEGKSPRELYGPGADSGGTRDSGVMEEAWLQVSEGSRCPLEDDLGFCLVSDSTFSIDTSGTCSGTDARVTAWMAPDALDTLEFVLHDDANNVPTGTGSVWLEHNSSSYVSTSGSATLARSQNVVSLVFEADFQTFLDAEPGPVASGLVRCVLP